MDYYYLARNLNISGGVKTLATHVWLLRKHGENAWLVNCGEPRDPWCLVLQEVTPYIIPASLFLTKNRSENGIIVVPEVHPPFIHKERREWRGSILVLLVLNWHYSDIFWGMRKVSSRSPSDRPKAFNLLEVLRRGVRFRRSVKRFGFHAILTNSEFSRRWVRRRLSCDPVVIPTGIERAYPSRREAGEQQIHLGGSVEESAGDISNHAESDVVRHSFDEEGSEHILSSHFPLGACTDGFEWPHLWPLWLIAKEGF